MISKNGKMYFTKHEHEIAMENTNALEYAKIRGYNLKKLGSYYTLTEHDSMRFSLDGKWHWNSQGIKNGNAINFMMEYEGKSFVQAICDLAGQNFLPTDYKKEIKPKIKDIKLPQKCENNKRIYAYLSKTRGIDETLIRDLLHEKKIYQGVFETKAGNKNEVLVMVGFDDKDSPKYASLRSLNSIGKSLKIDASGSDKSYPFVISTDKNADTVCVFESPIETMSYYTLCSHTGSDRLSFNMVSTGGVSSQACLDRYLKDNPQIKNIVVCYNNDEKNEINAGLIATEKIMQNYSDKYNVDIHFPAFNDWNDTLIEYNKNISVIKQTEYKSPKKQINKNLER